MMWKLLATVFCTSFTSLEMLDRMSPLRLSLKYPTSIETILANRSRRIFIISLVFMSTRILCESQRHRLEKNEAATSVIETNSRPRMTPPEAILSPSRYLNKSSK